MSGPAGYQRFFAELKRRSVFRAAAVYGAVAFVTIEAADLVFPRIPLPEWTIALVVWLALLCRTGTTRRPTRTSPRVEVNP